MKSSNFTTIRNILFIFLSLIIYSNSSHAFRCKDYTGNEVTSTNVTETANVYVNLQPSLLPGQNLVVDLSTSIECKNTVPNGRDDYVSLVSGSSYAGVLANFTGSVKYYGVTYNFPLTTSTSAQLFSSGDYSAWDTKLYLTPVSAASGVVVKTGDLIATLVMFQLGQDKGQPGVNVNTATFTWNIFASNDVVIPTGGCDVSARDVTITLPDYPGTAAVPLTVHCAKDQRLGFYLTGTTVDSANSVFANLATNSPAQGIGVQLSRSGSAVATNNNVSLGTVGTSPVDLGLTAGYGRTTGQVTAGNVQSIIGVTFVYL
ncbi:fimbrial protein [Entomohabitans teleogrylli]|uniref:fimbrial protein n=1 Tax=Entomohabitans teleogrylli TaxID=1384589 RepID=UPI00073D5077|nr:fimbrial protein [Entomohabitans teleogrylli]